MEKTEPDQAIDTLSTNEQDEQKPSPTTRSKSTSKRKSKSTMSSSKKSSNGRRKNTSNIAELRLQAIQALTNLPEDGQFFLITSAEGKDKDVIYDWN